MPNEIKPVIVADDGINRSIKPVIVADDGINPVKKRGFTINTKKRSYFFGTIQDGKAKAFGIFIFSKKMV